MLLSGIEVRAGSVTITFLGWLNRRKRNADKIKMYKK